MNPYRKGGLRTPRARRSFDPAYCKRSAACPSVNDGYMGAAQVGPRRWGRPGTAGEAAPPGPPAPRPRLRCPARPAALPPNAIAAIETLVRQRTGRTFIMRV